MLIEKGRIGAEQSSRNWGWCRQQNRDERELPISTKSLDLWERFAAETGENTGFRRCGLLYLSNNEAEIAGWARWRDFAKTVGVTTHMLSAAEAAEKGRATGRNWKGGVFSPTDGIADPASAAPAVARAIVKLGGVVIQNCAARGVETEAGRLSAVVTELGTIRTRTAILAGGAWASSFCRQLASAFRRPLFARPSSRSRAGRKAYRRAAYVRDLTDRARRWRPYARDQRPRARRCHAATTALRAAIPADVHEALEEPRAGRLEGVKSGHETLPAGGSTGRRRWKRCASSIPPRIRRPSASRMNARWHFYRN